MKPGLWNRFVVTPFSDTTVWILLALVVGSVHQLGLICPAEPDMTSTDGVLAKAEVARDVAGSPVWSLAFSKDGSQLAAATLSGDVWLKQVSAGRRQLVRRGPTGSAQSLTVSPGRDILAIAGGEPGVALMDLSTGTESAVPSLDGVEGGRTVAFSRDGKYFAVGKSGGEITIEEWSTRRRLATMNGHRSIVTALEFSPDGSMLATGHSTGKLRIWDVSSGKEITSVQAHGSGQHVASLAYSPDGSVLVTTGFPGRSTVKLWNPTTGEERESLPAFDSGVRDLAFSPDGRLLAMARGDGTAMLWGILEALPLGFVQANTRSLQSIVYSSDGRFLATGGVDGVVRLWDVALALTPGLRSL